MANSSLPLLLRPQRPVCHRQAVQREEQRLRVRGQVHQEAAEPGQQARRAKGGGGEGGGHPAADPAPQHRDTARRVREPHRHHPHPGTVSQQQSNSVETSLHPGVIPTLCVAFSVSLSVFGMCAEAQTDKKAFQKTFGGIYVQKKLFLLYAFYSSLFVK